ncbi:hypothetical protein V6N12_002639 [Hibiscus sabdariffa]|uniref:Uncharacterized protein n=1 Tax=Hibiscus sabdariffa TaxID=183260 RepID=A0ABR2EA06_9ROSI
MGSSLLVEFLHNIDDVERGKKKVKAIVQNLKSKKKDLVDRAARVDEGRKLDSFDDMAQEFINLFTKLIGSEDGEGGFKG